MRRLLLAVGVMVCSWALPVWAQSPTATPGTFTCLVNPDQHIVESEATCTKRWYENLGVTGKQDYIHCKLRSFTFTTPSYYNGTVLESEGDALNTWGCGSTTNPNHWTTQMGQATGTLSCPGNSTIVVNGAITSCTCSVGEKWDDAGQTCILPSTGNGGPLNTYTFIPAFTTSGGQSITTSGDSYGDYSCDSVGNCQAQGWVHVTSVPSCTSNCYVTMALPWTNFSLGASGCQGMGTLSTEVNATGTTCITGDQQHVYFSSDDFNYMQTPSMPSYFNFTIKGQR